MDSKTYCVLPWSHLHVAVNGRVHLCCVSKPIGTINKNSLEDLWNSTTLKRVRTQLLNNEKPTECQTCFYREDVLKGTSLRMDINEELGKYIDPIKVTEPDGSLKDMKLLYVDYRFNNLCNFKCKMCSPIYSSAIGSEIASLTNSKTMKIMSGNGPVLYEEIKKQYPHVIKIYFAGGEPVMQREHFQVLKDLIELNRASDITLIYSTNGSRFRTGMGDMFEYWKHFKRVEIVYSIDGYKKAAEYWRHGTDWEEIESNIRLANTYTKNIGAHIHSVVGWPNVFNWIEFIKYAIDTNLVNDLTHVINITSLDNPLSYSLGIVPKFKKNAIHAELLKLKEYVIEQHNTKGIVGETKLLSGIESLINSLHAPARIGFSKEGISDDGHNFIDALNRKDLQEFMTKNVEIDNFRGDDFFKAFPEHNDMKQYLGIKE